MSRCVVWPFGSWFRVFVVSCLMVVGTVGADAQAPRTIDKGAQSNVDDSLNASARTAVEWTALWKKHNYDKPAPAIDFSKEMVVAVFMGSRPTAGFAVEIVSATQRDGKLVVAYRVTAPKAGTVSAQVLTAPYHIAAIGKSSLPVTFDKQP
jgi:PrcB C-terminal